MLTPLIVASRPRVTTTPTRDAMVVFLPWKSYPWVERPKLPRPRRRKEDEEELFRLLGLLD